MNRLFDKLYAILRRDLLTTIRYRAGFATTAVGLVTQVAAFYFLSRAIGPGYRPNGVGYFPFLLVGTGLYTFFVMSAQTFLSAVQEAQHAGTLEVLMTTSTAPSELIALSSISAFAGKLANLTIYLLVGIALFGAPIHIHAVSCLIVLICSLAIALALGIVAASVQVTFQKGGAFVWLLGSVVWFLSGAMFPVESLPPALTLLGRLIPLTYAIDGMRMALLQGYSVTAMAPTLAVLAAFSLTLLPLSLSLLSVSLRRARRDGTLSFY
jgi:ABC-2 type transport system permease protein